ncbi:MAG TPA: Xaa-Pro peptidase family protein [Alphaproteobacteria bacterium]|nr:Xaa-Pro peptidase family protein [Alphaproteobacteria bacterium]
MADKDLSFSIEEFRARLGRVRELMQAERLDALILDDIEAMTYVSGYGVSETLWRACIVPAAGDPCLVLRALDVAPARERSWLADFVGFRDWEDPVAVVSDQVCRRTGGRARIGVDLHSTSMSAGRFERLRQALPDRTFVDFGNAMWDIRARKSAAELVHMRRAAAIADAAMAEAIAAVREGGSERDVARAAALAYMQCGADDALVGPLTSGRSWDSLHGHLHDHPLEPGAVMHIELVPRVRDYSSRIMRSVVVGPPNRKQLAAAKTMIALQDAQIAALRPGARACDVDKVLRQGMIDAGLRQSYDNVTGYTLGAYPYPTLRISDFHRAFTPAATWSVEAGMTFHMYTSAEGLAFSETVLVTEGGPERLTRTERKLFSTSG